MTVIRGLQIGFSTLLLLPLFLHAQETKIAPPAPSTLTIAISEFVAVNDAGLRDEDGDSSDWLELLNYGDQAVDLSALFLTDKRSQRDRWQFPPKRLPPGKRLVVFLSGKDRRDSEKPLHTNFSLAKDGGYLGLITKEGQVPIHEYAPDYPAQKADLAFGIPFPESLPAQRSGFLSYLAPTPGRPNSPSYRGRAQKVSFSQDRGWQSQGFELELQSRTSDAEIRYTVDGTAPTAEHGIIYREPLPIRESTVIRAIAIKPGFLPSRVSTRTYLIVDDVLRQSPDGLPPPSFPYTWGENKVDYGMDARVVSDPRYASEIVDGFYSLPSFSIVVPTDALFDNRSGIYANAERDGREWERPCSLEYFTFQQSEGFQIDCGLRIRGGFSRRPNNPKHSFRLFFRDQYGPSQLEFPLFGKEGSDRFDHLDLRTFQNYGWHLGSEEANFLRDQFARDLQRATGQPSARGEFCHLFINGQYWGLYNTCERIKASYGANYFGGRKSSYDSVKKGRSLDPETGHSIGVMANDGNLKAWKRLWQHAKNGLESNESYFEMLGRFADGSRNPSGECLLDVDNLIDYMLIIFYSGNYDGPVSAWGSNMGANNWYGIRNRDSRDGFRFFIWDAEHTFKDVREDRTGPFYAGHDYGGSNPQWIYQQCLENAEFRVRVGDRVHHHFSTGGTLSPERVIERFRERVFELESAVICESARWGDSRFTPSGGKGSPATPPRNREDHWYPVVHELLEDHFPRRSGIVQAQLFAHGVISDVAPPEVIPLGEDRIKILPTTRPTFYTTDGKDPRIVGGGLYEKALEVPETGLVLSSEATLRLRVRRGDDWSALVSINARGL